MMSREISYEECINFIEMVLKINLYPYQKEIIKCFCEGKEVRTARVCGRSISTEAYGKYIAKLYSENDYSKVPDVTISYSRVIED